MNKASAYNIACVVLLLVLAMTTGWFGSTLQISLIGSSSLDLLSGIAIIDLWVVFVSCIAALYGIFTGKKILPLFKFVQSVFAGLTATALVLLSLSALRDFQGTNSCTGFFGSPSTCTSNAIFMIPFVFFVLSLFLSPVALVALCMQLQAWRK